MKQPSLSIVVPAYNEEVRLAPCLEQIDAYFHAQGYDWDLTVVSDGSKDATAQIVRDFAKSHSEFSVIEYSPNRGKGHAVRTGMLRAKGDWVLFMDADLATPLEETAKLRTVLESGEVLAIGSRPLKESKLEKHQPWWREFLGRASNKLVQALAVKGVDDTQCGFKMMTREVAQDIFSRCKFDGFSFDFEALMIAQDLGYPIHEIPIRWLDQEGSKVVPWRDYPRSLRDLFKLRMMGRAKRLEKNAS